MRAAAGENGPVMTSPNDPPRPPPPASSAPPASPGPAGPAGPAGSAGSAGELRTIAPETGGHPGFRVRLDNFEGPFDLLLGLIAKHRMDVTEVSLSKVTDEFVAHIRAMGPDWDLDAATGFLVVAATLLDLKAARLLPAAEIEDEEDLALLEARDLLFARLLQYRAYKQAAAVLAERWAAELRQHPRTAGLEPHHTRLLPEVVITLGPEGLARLAARALTPRPRPVVYVDHVHTPSVSVRDEAEVVVDRLTSLGSTTFGRLVEDAGSTLVVVARFLALLDLYRERVLDFEQPEALGELLVHRVAGAGAGAGGIGRNGERTESRSER